MRVLVFQHIAVEHPGIFRDFLAADGIGWDAVELDAGETIPNLTGYDVLWVMGGPMDVWQTDAYPWLAEEMTVIRDWVEADRPFFGVCLGHQLLAAALGGMVDRMAAPEVGIMPVELTEAGRRDPLFRGVDRTSLCLQWHGAAVTLPPPGAELLACSPACAAQAIRVRRAAYGLQYHVEATADTVPEWGCVPEYARALDAVQGAGALDRLGKETTACLPALNRTARRLYDNFMALVRGA